MGKSDIAGGDFLLVDSLGYTAIDFTVLNFAFTEDSHNRTIDPEKFRHCDFGRNYGHFRQVKAWKNGVGTVDLSSSAGHEALFHGRKIYPLKFLTKHYPLRSIEQANRKVYIERLPRGEKEKNEKLAPPLRSLLKIDLIKPQF